MLIKKMSILFSNKKIIFLFLLMALSFYKSPYIFVNGRFIAEEGSYFFRYTYLFGYIEGLTFLLKESGYFNLWANLASIFANLVPINLAPLITVYFAFSVKILLLLYILFQKSNFLENNNQRYIASFLVIVAPTMVAEIWLNTLTSQVYFTIISTVILFQINNKNLLTKLSPVVLFFSTLSSIQSCLLAPFFLRKYVKQKDKINLYNLIVIFAGSLTQFIIYFYIRFNNLEWGGLSNERYILSLDKLLNFTYNVIFKSFLGTPFTKFLYFNSLQNIFIFVILLSLLSLVILFLIKSLKIIVKDKILLTLIILFICQSLLAIYAGKANHVSGRYAVVPSIMLLFIFVRLFYIKSPFKLFAGVLLLMSASFGLYEFKKNNKYPQFLMCIDCPIWEDEISKWRQDENYKLKIWDYSTNKTMSLKK